MKNLNYLKDHILYQVFNIILSISEIKHETVTDNPSIKIYVTKIESRITFKTNTGYYLEILTPETMNVLGGSKSRITKDKNGENMPH